MKRLVSTLAAVGLAVALSTGAANAAVLFTYEVEVNSPPTYNPFPPPVSFPANNVGGLSVYTIIPQSTAGAPFLELDAAGLGTDLVMANNNLSNPPGTPSSNHSFFNFPYTLNLTVYRDDNPLDFATFAVTGNITTDPANPVRSGGGTTGNVYTLGIPITMNSAVTNTPFTLTRLDFTFPTAPPIGGGIGSSNGGFSAHILANVVPEPGSVTLLTGFLVVGTGLVSRRKRQN